MILHIFLLSSLINVHFTIYIALLIICNLLGILLNMYSTSCIVCDHLSLYFPLMVVMGVSRLLVGLPTKIVSEYDQEILQSQTWTIIGGAEPSCLPES